MNAVSDKVLKAGGIRQHSKVKPEYKEKYKEQCNVDHSERLLGMRDAMDVLSGKWKIQLLGALLFCGRMRFMDLLREVDGIAAKMLSKELHDLEAHQLVKRTVMDTKPVTVEYEITPYGRSLEKLVVEISQWGYQHRQRILGRTIAAHEGHLSPATGSR